MTNEANLSQYELEKLNEVRSVLELLTRESGEIYQMIEHSNGFEIKRDNTPKKILLEPGVDIIIPGLS